MSEQVCHRLADALPAYNEKRSRSAVGCSRRCAPSTTASSPCWSVPSRPPGRGGGTGKSLSNDQILAWNKLALSQEGRSVLDSKAKISGSNLYTRLNYWIVACGGIAVSNPPALVGVENLGAATIACQGEAFTFTVTSVPADVTNLKLVIEASEGQSIGVTRAHGKAVAIKMVASPSTSAVDIRSDYVAKHGAPSAAAPKIFFRYYLVNTATGEKSGTMLAESKWTAGE